MSDVAEVAFTQAISGPNNKAVLIDHRWFRIFAQNHDGHAALVIRVSLAPDQAVADGRGFTVRTERGGDDNYVRITSTSPGISLVFLKLVETIIERTASERSVASATQTLLSAVDEFIAFGSRLGGRLSDSEVRGTFAELVFFRALVDHGLDANLVLTSWRGPFSLAGLGNHDFVFPNGVGVEVKSVRQGATAVSVSSATQLVPSAKPLALAVLPVEETTVGVSFREYARNLGEFIAKAGHQCERGWQEALQALGLDLDDEWYEKFLFLPGTWECYDVREGFPYLESSRIAQGIVRVRYSLKLLRLLPFEMYFDDVVERIRK